MAEGVYLLARWHWYRRLRGGHWERWWVTDRHSFRWLLMPEGCANHLREGTATKPAGVLGTPTCETWT